MKNKNNCPICGLTLHQQKDTHELSLLFLCFNPTIDDPLHSYVKKVDKIADQIINEEFSVKVGNKYFLFSNNYLEQKSIFKSDNDKLASTCTSFIIPDFPKLDNLKSKIQLISTFG
jgi:hypothetical protein